MDQNNQAEIKNITADDLNQLFKNIDIQPLTTESLLQQNEFDFNNMNSVNTANSTGITFTNPTTTNPNQYNWNYGNSATVIPPTITIGTTTTSTSGIYQNNTQGSFDFDGSIERKVERVVKKNIQPILDRLAILENPEPEVMEKFEALKMAYDHYRVLEALMHTEIQKLKSQK